MPEISASDAHPSITRVSDAKETAFTFVPLKNAIQQAFVDSGGTLSHHHAVGAEHAAWLEQDIPLLACT